MPNTPPPPWAVGRFCCMIGTTTGVEPELVARTRGAEVSRLSRSDPRSDAARPPRVDGSQATQESNSLRRPPHWCPTRPTRVLRGSIDATLRNPAIDLSDIEPHELADLAERNPTFADQPTHEPLRHGQTLGEPGDVDERLNRLLRLLAFCCSHTRERPPRALIRALAFRSRWVPRHSDVRQAAPGDLLAHGCRRCAHRQQLALRSLDPAPQLRRLLRSEPAGTPADSALASTTNTDSDATRPSLAWVGRSGSLDE